MPPTDYDLLPYVSLPVCYTQPAHLAAAALLNGIELPVAETARVLELGCASGGNIIPLAAQFPSASFVGIDLGRRHVEDGRERIAALGLTNIEITQADLTTVSFGQQSFDYIISHGVFSWVQEEAREAILRLCNRHLAPNGAAVISYNVLPGWHLRRTVRDICLRFADAEGGPMARVRKAREALNDIAHASPAGSPYGQMLREEAARMAKQPASYILGEFLAEHNHPLHFHEFASLAARHELAYLGEATQAASAGARGGSASPDRPADAEQYADYVTGRPFRRSVLIRSAEASRIRRPASAENLHRLHFSPQMESSRMAADASAASAEDGIEAWVLAQFARKGASTLTLLELAARAEGEGLLIAGTAAEALHDGLFRLVMMDALSISTVPLLVGSTAARRPRLWKVALAESASGQPWLSSLAHMAVPLSQPMRVLAPLINGTHDLTELTGRAVEALSHGALTLGDVEAAEGPRTHLEIIAGAAGAVAKTLDFLARNALLAPDAG